MAKMSKSSKIKIYFGLLLFVIIAVFIQSCKDNTSIVGSTNGASTNTAKKSTISGQVVYESTGIPIDSATIIIQSSSISKTVYTTSQVNFQPMLNLQTIQIFQYLLAKPATFWIRLT